MISGLSDSATVNTGTPSLVLEIAGREEPTPLPISVLVQNLSMGGVTLAVTNPWVIVDWEHYRGRDCSLRWEGPGYQQPINIKGKLSWTKFTGDSQSRLSLGLQLLKPAGDDLKRLSDHITHTPGDIKGLWERYDQVQEIPPHAHLVNHFYRVGLVLLAGGVILQLFGSPSLKILGWLSWFLGSLGIAAKVMQSFRQKRVPQ